MYLTESAIKGSATTGRPNKNWSGVSASRSSELPLTGVSGLIVKVCLSKHIVVASTGNITRLLPRIEK